MRAIAGSEKGVCDSSETGKLLNSLSSRTEGQCGWWVGQVAEARP